MFFNKVENDWGELEYVPTLAGNILLIVFAVLIFALAVFLVKKRIEKSGRKLTAKQITFCAMAVALGTVLSNLKLFKFPTGGSITVLFMLVACLPGYWYGISVGILSGITSGLLQLIFDPYIIHPAQLLLDYVCAFGALGLSGFFAEFKPSGTGKEDTEASGKKIRFHLDSDKKNMITTVVMGYLFAMLSGVFFFAAQIPHEEGSVNFNLLFGILFALLYAVVIILGFVIKDNLIRGYTTAVIGRYIFAVLSGWIFFGAYAWDGWSALPYSLAYNAIYIFAEAIITVIILLIPAVRKVMGQIKTMATSE